MKASDRIVFNTGMLYLRMILTVGVSLYSTRIVLRSLGASDFGIFTIVAGLIGMLAFLNSAMTLSTQRNLSYKMGRNDNNAIKSIFANSLVLHILIGIVLIVVFECFGIYLLNSVLKIEPERIHAAELLFHFVSLTTFLSIITVPFDALIESNEDMLFVAIIGVVESLLRLLIAFYLLYTSSDKLITYGVLLFLIAVVIAIIKKLYCGHKYTQSRVNLAKFYDTSVILNLASFAGWYLFGIIAGIFRNEGVAIVLNIFFGTIVNAAYGIANQVNGQLAFFSQTMMKTIRPQMIKSEGNGNREQMLNLAIIASKFSFYLFSIFSIPLFIEMEWVLGMWLNDVPVHTIVFCRLILVLTLINQLSVGIMSAVVAIGKIKYYQIVAGSIMLLTLPIGFVFLKIGYPAYSILLVSIFLEILNTIFRIYYFNFLTSYPLLKFMKEVFISCFVPFTLTFLTVYFAHSQMNSSFFRVVVICATTTIIYFPLIYFIGSKNEEKRRINELFTNIKFKILSITNK
ncbi:lipopolysaccharide biosynthesis protein [Pedobacter immunditicola]|uniref:lipopolysaccharide biosynthesis protein n=1 Tax=Pedobacter immunditicola TaxID=3133440 RepID=UPI0030AA3C2E